MTEFAISLSVEERGKKKPEYSIESDINGEVSAKDLLNMVKNTLIFVAKNARNEEEARGFDPQAVRVVDNKFNKVEEEVSALGKIEYFARQDLKELINFAYDQIIQKSRIINLTGNYARSNVVLYNGIEVARTKPELEKFLQIRTGKFKENDRIEFVNITPYANKLELEGLEKGSPRTRSVGPGKGREGPSRVFRRPNGVYYQASRNIKNKYKGNSIIKFQPILGSDIGLNSPAKGSGVGRIRQTGTSAGRTYVYPSIMIIVKTAGVIQ